MNVNVTGYRVEVNWGWGRSVRFQEVERAQFTVNEPEAIKEWVRTVAQQIAKRYCYDCGQKDMPLNPQIYSVTVTPEFETVYHHEPEWLHNDVFEEYCKSQEGA